MATDASLILVRHGETEGQSSIRYYGRTDVPLSELGRAQMRAAARELATLNFTHVFASPLSRAHEGARIVAGDRLQVITINEFVEVDFGLFEGLTADEIRSRHPEEFARWERGRLSPHYAYPDGESRAAFSERIERGVARMLGMAGAAPAIPSILVVAHRGVIRAIARILADVEPNAIALGSIHVLERSDRWRPSALDLTAHLDGVR
jgi:broad specificity phosphatase PhoE